MGRKYEGLTNKITVKFTDEELTRIVQYGWRKPERKRIILSEVIREMCDNAALTVELSDAIENKIANLKDVADILDRIPEMEICSKAVREAACVMDVVCRYGLDVVSTAEKSGRNRKGGRLNDTE